MIIVHSGVYLTHYTMLYLDYRGKQAKNKLGEVIPRPSVVPTNGNRTSPTWNYFGKTLLNSIRLQNSNMPISCVNRNRLTCTCMCIKRTFHTSSCMYACTMSNTFLFQVITMSQEKVSRVSETCMHALQEKKGRKKNILYVYTVAKSFVHTLHMYQHDSADRSVKRRGRQMEC